MLLSSSSYHQHYHHHNHFYYYYYHYSDTGVTITDGIWHHVCVTLGNDAFELYFNGDLKASTTADGQYMYVRLIHDSEEISNYRC